MKLIDIQLGTDCLGIGKLAETITTFLKEKTEPKQILERAKARKEAMNLLSEGISNNPQVQIEYNDGTLSIKERAQITQENRAIVKQQNIEAVSGYAYEELLGDAPISPEPVDEDWITRFFNKASDISTDEMQVIWGKVLAGEIKQPDSYSLRTLDILSNLSKKEAMLFKRVSNYVFTGNNLGLLFSDTKLLEKYGVKYSDLLTLDESRLLKAEKKVINFYASTTNTLHYPPHLIIFHKGDEKEKISYSSFVLTQSGLEIYGLFTKEPDTQYLQEVVSTLRKINEEKKYDVDIDIMEDTD